MGKITAILSIEPKPENQKREVKAEKQATDELAGKTVSSKKQKSTSKLLFLQYDRLPERYSDKTNGRNAGIYVSSAGW